MKEKQDEHYKEIALRAYIRPQSFADLKKRHGLKFLEDNWAASFVALSKLTLSLSNFLKEVHSSSLQTADHGSHITRVI